ncbi:hypothetical protein COU54_01835 [Candidatus Pacearchaeota archaeon CG10_big_fil_rev_8_21_14_0_10_31_24]|nr:MAG: hypothetical protein COU54_01835 [Candidatus Pacearchaeota archaeon CG10_big_fil_rev_8_21_14_0_10_31_24]
MVISLLLISILPLVSSKLEFDFKFTPEKPEFGKEIVITLTSNTTENYDVKAFIEKEDKILSEILSQGEWKNPFYYLQSAFPKEKSFTIKQTIESENGYLCVRLRKTGSTPYDEVCKEIILIPDQKSDDSSQAKAETTPPSETIIQDESSDSESTTLHSQDNKTSEKSKIIEPILISQNLSENNTPILPIALKNEPIILKNPSKESPPLQNQEIITPSEKFRNRLLYFTNFLFLIIILLLLLRKL